MGWLWQGRYSMPLALGVPMLAAYVLSESRDEVYGLLKRLAAGLGIAMGIAVVAAFFWAGRRNAVGTDGPLLFIGREDWRSPIPFVLLLTLNALIVAALVSLFLKVVRRQGADDRATDVSSPPSESRMPSTMARVGTST